MDGASGIVKGREIRWISDAWRLFAPALADAAEGTVQIAYLDGARRVIEVAGADGSVAWPLLVQPVLRRAVQLGAAGLMVARSHGAGDAAPTAEDIQWARRLIQIGRDLEIQLHDCLIFGGGGWISFRRRGLL